MTLGAGYASDLLDRLDPDIVEQVVLEPQLCWEIATPEKCESRAP